MRHLVTVARAMLEGRMPEEGALGTAVEQVRSLAEAARDNHKRASKLLDSALKEKSSLSEDSERSRCKLEEAEGGVAERLERLHDRRRELEGQLDRVKGEILAAEQQQAEALREREVLGRVVGQKVASLEDTMQALSVQMQDYENEEDALEEASKFFRAAAAMVSADKDAQLASSRGRMQGVLSDHYAFLELHLGRQLAQLRLLSKLRLFCEGELGAAEERTLSMSRLGMSQMASEEGTRRAHLEEKLNEAVGRIRAIQSDVGDMRHQMTELEESSERDADEDTKGRISAPSRRIWGLIQTLESELADAGVPPGAG
eukprot:CAMPEP_0169442216 /NCGR_PEP_ID=MMETSP1042-20121227/8707_1 /TAXON_ID=464988 /ORGANISM="Hemiselmis andersenii, Strain CCMP1180" /LENGTH=315 /DNA_ID=CAMNT_0009553369 /DNA_START=1183 /DNA_END=2126 /DNA_ORIENTATION=-